MEPRSASLLLLLLLLIGVLLTVVPSATSYQVCVIGSGIAGSAVSHFLTNYSSGAIHDILILERNSVAGGRMATITIGGDTFEAGGTIIHPKNLYALNFASLLGLQHAPKLESDSYSWIGIWDGSKFVFQTLPPPTISSSAIYRFMYSFLDGVRLFWRYGLSLIRMNGVTQVMLNKFLLYYKEFESRPVFQTAEEMLKWSGLYELTQRTLQEELTDAKLSPLIISELITVITRVNYGQSVRISGLAGVVSLAGSEEGVWHVDGGNCKIAAGLIKLSNATLHLNEEVIAVSDAGAYYEVNSTNGNKYNCGVTVIATPLDEQNISFTPSISIPTRKLQHTYATFVRGLLNPAYFGLNSVSDIPFFIGTLELPDLPFSCIRILRKHTEEDITYKVFSRAPLEDDVLDAIFSSRMETSVINWAAYPHYHAPEKFAPFLLDGKHLYYINTFESATSAIEVSAVAAENIARLVLSRLNIRSNNISNIRSVSEGKLNLYFEL